MRVTAIGIVIGSAMAMFLIGLLGLADMADLQAGWLVVVVLAVAAGVVVATESEQEKHEHCPPSVCYHRKYYLQSRGRHAKVRV